MNFTEQQLQEAMNRPTPFYITTDNLRDRNNALQKDCFIRGTLAEIFFRDFFQNSKFNVKSNVLDNCVDIDLQIIQNFNNPINIEIKTSLIPYRGFDIYESADLKIYKNNNIEYDIKWDIGIQVYFDRYKQEWENIIKCCNDKQQMLEEYKNLNFSCSWITRDDAINYSNSLPFNNRTWTFNGSYKEFWRCPLSIHNNNLGNLIDVLEEWTQI